MTRLQRRLLMPLALIAVLAACSTATFDTRDDLTINAHVKTALLDERVIGGLRLGVETYQGIVTLSGTVPSAGDVDRAIAAARKVRGVREVKSALKVQPEARGLEPGARSPQRSRYMPVA